MQSTCSFTLYYEVYLNVINLHNQIQSTQTKFIITPQGGWIRPCSIPLPCKDFYATRVCSKNCPRTQRGGDSYVRGYNNFGLCSLNLHLLGVVVNARSYESEWL